MSTHEFCERCREPTTTTLPPTWARRVGAGLVLCVVPLPAMAPFLASDPIVTIVSFLAMGFAAGPIVGVLRARGACARCDLERGGLAVRRLGLRRFLATGVER